VSDEPQQSEPSVQEKPVVTKLVQSGELGSPSIEPWKLSSLEDSLSDKSASLSDEVYQKMQAALQPKLEQQAKILKKEAYDKAFQKGYEEGLLKGQEEGLKQGEAEGKAQVIATFEPKIEQFEAVLTSLYKPFEALEQKIYSELVDFSLHVAQTVINKSVSDYEGWILQVVQETVSTLPESSSTINIYLHPDDLAFLQISKPSISENWQLHESVNVELGTCLVKQDYSTVLNSWIARFDEVAQQVSVDIAEEPSSS